MLCILDYCHQDDTFATTRSSGLNAVKVVGIDEQARIRRHRRYILENIALSAGGIQAVKDLHYKWVATAETEALDTLGLG
jgi:hypothetical protein